MAYVSLYHFVCVEPGTGVNSVLRTSSGAAFCRHLYSCCVRRAASAAACSSQRILLRHVLLQSCNSSCSSSTRSLAAFSAVLADSSCRASLACFNCRKGRGAAEGCAQSSTPEYIHLGVAPEFA
jgi:hypothetical protein